MGPTNSANDQLSGITRRWWSGMLLLLAATALILAFVYAMARYAILREVRQQARAVAMAVAKAICAEDLEAIRSPADVYTEAYRRVSQLLGDIERTNPDVRYVYTMRRAEGSERDDTWDYEYIVDAPARDANGDGLISRQEMAEQPGTRYSARHLPAMQRAWYEPSADAAPSPDPPYPDLLSGYAPIRNARGQTVAIVGTDITAETISRKLAVLRVTIIPAWMLFSLLAGILAHLYYRQSRTMDEIQAHCADLAKRVRILRAANLWLTDPAFLSADAMPLARSMQQRLLPVQFGHSRHIVVDTFYLGCDMVGGDLYDVFDLDNDHMGMYMADVAGHGVAAAMVAGLLKSAVSAHSAEVGSDGLAAVMLEPKRLLAHLNRLLQSELPPNAFVTMVYAVLDIPRCTLTLASAGHPAPLRLDPTSHQAVALSIPIGPAIGLLADVAYKDTVRPLHSADRLVFYSDGVTDAVNSEGCPFGLENLIRSVEESSDYSPGGLTRTITQALETHRGIQPLRDDCSVLVVEIR